MKIIFAGAHKFSIPALNVLLCSKHQICAIYTKPDKPVGRGLKVISNLVKQIAIENNILIYQPKSINNSESIEILKAFNADVFVDVACGFILPEALINLPKYGCINIHPSLLPRWRGAAPIQRAILAGDDVTGVTIIQMDAGLDTGDILKQSSLSISDKDTTQSLFDITADLGAKLLIDVLSELSEGVLVAVPQEDSNSSYANKIKKEEAHLDWRLTAVELDRVVRAFNPWPIANTYIDMMRLRIWETKPIDCEVSVPPGHIVEANKNGIDVSTSEGILRIKKMQLPGTKILSVSDVINGYSHLFVVGKQFQ